MKELSLLTDELTARIRPIHERRLAKTISDYEEGYMDALVEFRSYINSPACLELLERLKLSSNVI